MISGDSFFQIYLKFPLTFAILGLFTSAVVTSQTYLLLINEDYTFWVSSALFFMSLVFAFVVWISVNDIPFQGMCGFISILLFFSAVADSLISPNWHLTAHNINKMAIFSTNWIASYSALSFLWSKIVSLVVGPPSRAMPISEKHEGFVYVSFNMFIAMFFAYYTSSIEADSLFGLREQMINNSWFYLALGTGYGFLLGVIVGFKRSRYHELPNAKDGVVIDIE